MFNDLFFQGEVLEIKSSRNHSFGILLLKLDSVNTGKFIDTLLKEGIYPYKVKGGKAEVYCGVPDGIQKGDRVVIDSGKKMAFYHYSNEAKTYKGDLSIVIDSEDIDYVKENTEFKKQL